MNNLLDLTGKVAFITGGSQGIGKTISETLAEMGAEIVIGDIDEEKGKATVEEIIKNGGKSAFYACNVAESDSVNETVSTIVKNHSKIDILVNNAGITRDGLIMRMNDEQWDLVISINLKGAFNCIRAVTRPMMKQRSGVIVNISSVIGVMGNAGQANYAASKAGLIGLTKSAAKELASRGIRANAIAPGFIQTQMTDMLPDDVKNNYLAGIPLKKLGEPRDVAELVLFLTSDASKYITGQVINIDGGLIM